MSINEPRIQPFSCGQPCAEFDCNNYGGYECPKTRIAGADLSFKCNGAVACRNCYWMGLDGQTRFCTVGDHTSKHYCYFEYKSGFQYKKGGEK